MLKKIALMSLFLLCLLSLPLSLLSVNAAQQQQYELQEHATCALIVGSTDFKLNKNFEYLAEHIGDYADLGRSIQQLYSKYWFDHGELEEGKLTKDVMLDFCRYSGYDRVLYIIISDPQIEKTRSTDWWTGLEATQSHVSLEIKAVLVNSERIIHMSSSIDDANSAATEKRAKRRAFKHALNRFMWWDMTPYITGEKQ
jgi:hypothetical protein